MLDLMPSADSPSRSRADEGPAVVVAAEDPVALRRMASALAADGIACVVQIAGARRAIERAAPASILILACDVADPAGITRLRKLRRSARHALVVVVSPPSNGIGVRRASEAGAVGVVFEPDLERTLGPSVRAVAVGQSALPRDVAGCLKRPAFSHRERQVLSSVAEGLTNGEIAQRLFLSESTVKSHLSSAFTKLGVRSRREAAAIVLDPDDSLGADFLAGGASSDPVRERIAEAL